MSQVAREGWSADKRLCSHYLLASMMRAAQASALKQGSGLAERRPLLNFLAVQQLCSQLNRSMDLLPQKAGVLHCPVLEQEPVWSSV